MTAASAGMQGLDVDDGRSSNSAPSHNFSAFFEQRRTSSSSASSAISPSQQHSPELTKHDRLQHSTLSIKRPDQNGTSLLPQHRGVTGDAKADQLKWDRNIPVVVPIALWIFLSSTVILMNKWILSDLGFSYPIALTTIHLAFQTAASRLLRRYTHLVDGAKTLEQSGKMNRDVFLKNIVPIGVLFSFSLVLSNWVYLRLSVSFIQMIKAVTPVVVLAVSVAFKVKTANAKLWGIVSIISIGVAIASYGEIDFDLLGFSVQLFAILIESCRLVLIQILLQGFGMDPLVSLYYFAPVCLATNSIALVLVEGFAPFAHIADVGIFTITFNAACTFFLNLSSVWLIGKASGLVLTLSGVIKDILLILGSFAILGSTITMTQVFGYAVALTGLVLFKTQG